MTDPLDSPQLEPTGEPQIARIGGRRSAIVGALAVVVLLVAVVWVGISGRTTPPLVSPTIPAVAIVASAEPTAAEPTSGPTPLVIGQPDGPISQAADDVFGAFATFGDNRYITILSEPEPGHLVGRIALPLPIPQNDGTFSFQQFSAPDAPGRPVPIGTWAFNVATVAADSPLVTVVDEAPLPLRAMTKAPKPTQRGFHLTVTAQRSGSTGELTIDIRVGPLLARADPPRVDRPIVVTYDRTRGRYNYCRWDLTPLSAPPRPGTDESAC